MEAKTKMADKNLHDIKIDDLDSPKKTPLKNILTLLALLFIILVISVVITKLILNTDEGSKIENNDSKVELTSTENDANTSSEEETETSNSEVTIPVLNPTITERNLTSVIKTPLSSHEPKEIETYKTPKKNNTAVETTTNTEKAPVVKRTYTEPKTITQPKKEYIPKAEVKQTAVAAPVVKKTTYFGGQQKAVSNSYYIKVGTYRDTSTVVRKIKNNNFNYSLVKVENDTTLTRVLVGPFFSRNQANTQLDTVQENILKGAYITKAK
ncbi:MAG: Unknown protein [uncultured Sulfurovum sp.]|uniref:SPOR domain-containing protein n=1 Tax=uncultured Sulfurovum sp. TaxID=269237 RepID=A0A6S6TEY0_9BACT|nr:MAG: Unknown protein [uncultured Sulfurovum sp.]